MKKSIRKRFRVEINYLNRNVNFMLRFNRKIVTIGLENFTINLNKLE
jgi:hypothetical protein